MSAVASRTLLLHVASDGICALTSDGSLIEGMSPRLREEARRADRVVALVPGEAVSVLEVPRISRQRQRLLQALPYAVEEQLAQAIEDMHIVAPPRIEGERVAVACAAHADMRLWLGQLAEAGIEPDRMLPDMLALPPPGDGAVLARVARRALVRTGPDAGFAVEVDALDSLSVGIGSQAPAFQVENRGALLQRLAPFIHQASSLDLLAAPYRARRRRGAIGPWGLAASLALLSLLLGLGLRGAELLALRAAHGELQLEAQRLYRMAIPGEGVVADPVRMLRAESARASAKLSGGAMPLLGRVAPLLAGGTTTLRMDAIEYRAGTLEVAVVTPDVPTLDQLRERLGALPGLRAELSGASPGESGVQGRLRIEEATP